MLGSSEPFTHRSFPEYLFVILDLGRDRWLSIRSTIGISSLFTCDGRPVPVPAGVVEALIAQSNGDNLALFQEGLAAGLRVRIVSAHSPILSVRCSVSTLTAECGFCSR